MPTPMSQADKEALERLRIEVNPTDGITQDRPGENPTRKIDKYRTEEATSTEGRNRTERTDRAAMFILAAADLNGGVAPYAFTLPSGDPSSLDWWVVSVLSNAGDVTLVAGADGFVTGVRPTAAMRLRYGRVRAGAPYRFEAISDIEQIEADADLSPTERSAQILCRIGQGAFRKDLMHQFGSRCAVTGCDLPELLRASHIVAWAADASLRRDPTNGLLLCAHIDAAFDAHLISFADDGTMMFSQRLSEQKAKALGIHGKLTATLCSRAHSHLKRHRARLAEFDLQA